MSQLTAQMQEKMTLRLSELRHKVIGAMGDAGERIKKRPALKDDQSFAKIKTHPVMNPDQDGAMILGFAMGMPGIECGMVNTALDVAAELYGDRKATLARPQDNMTLTPKQECEIREKNRQDLALFESLDNKLNTLNTYISQGYKLGLDWNGELIPWEQVDDPKLTMKKQNPQFDFAPLTSANSPFKPMGMTA